MSELSPIRARPSHEKLPRAPLAELREVVHDPEVARAVSWARDHSGDPLAAHLLALVRIAEVVLAEAEGEEGL